MVPQVMWGDRVLAELLCPRWAVLELLMAHVAPGDWKKDDAGAASTVARAPSAPPSSETQRSNQKLVRLWKESWRMAPLPLILLILGAA